MGLGIAVGMLADLLENDEEGAEWTRKALVGVNAVLKKNGLPEHVEPTELPSAEPRSGLLGFPYSWLHYLRRVYAHAAHDDHWAPRRLPPMNDPAADPVLEDETMMMSSHLLCHSDCEGYYVPVEFPEPLFDDEGLIPGGMLGSSHQLMRELVQVAPVLGIQLANGVLSDDEVRRIDAIVEAEGAQFIEHAVWLSLFEASRLSLEHKTAVCFC